MFPLLQNPSTSKNYQKQIELRIADVNFFHASNHFIAKNGVTFNPCNNSDEWYAAQYEHPRKHFR